MSAWPVRSWRTRCSGVGGGPCCRSPCSSASSTGCRSGPRRRCCASSSARSTTPTADECGAGSDANRLPVEGAPDRVAGMDDRAAALLAAYDEQLRTDAETPSALVVEQLGPLRLVDFGGGRGFVTYRDLGGADADG